MDKDHTLQNLRTSDNGSYIDFLRDRLNELGIEAIACDLGEEARGHRYALLLPHDGDAPRAWQALHQAPGEHERHQQLADARDNRLIAFCRSTAVRRASLALLALVLLGEYLTFNQWLAIGLIMAASMGSALTARRAPQADHLV